MAKIMNKLIPTHPAHLVFLPVFTTKMARHAQQKPRRPAAELRAAWPRPPRTRASECSTCQALEKKPIWVNLITTEACSPEAWNHGECIGKSLGKENPGDTLLVIVDSKTMFFFPGGTPQ